MDIFGIGPLEIALIILLAIIIFGPKDIANAGKTVGKSLNKLVRSESWKNISRTSRELKNLPNRLMRESGLEELEKTTQAEMSQVDKTIRQTTSSSSPVDSPPGVIVQPGKKTGDPNTEKDATG
jgi:Sec-independent protein translocase protein TatA